MPIIVFVRTRPPAQPQSRTSADPYQKHILFNTTLAIAYVFVLVNFILRVEPGTRDIVWVISLNFLWELDTPREFDLKP